MTIHPEKSVYKCHDQQRSVLGKVQEKLLIYFQMTSPASQFWVLESALSLSVNANPWCKEKCLPNSPPVITLQVGPYGCRIRSHCTKKKHLAVWQTTQRGKKYKEITLFKRETYFLFKVPLLCLPSSKVFVVPCDHICKGPIGIALTLSIVWFVGSFTLSFLTVCVCVIVGLRRRNAWMHLRAFALRKWTLR